jgi:peptidoglycan hydrolase-like protein with peptidoglycan-binding domain
MQMQQFLSDQMYYGGPISGNFGTITEDAVKQFQRANSLIASGIFDTQSRSKANEILAGASQPSGATPSSSSQPSAPAPTNPAPSPSSSTPVAGNPGNPQTPLRSSSPSQYTYKPRSDEEKGFFGIGGAPLFCNCSGNFLVKVDGPYGGMFIAKDPSKIPIGLAMGSASGDPVKCKMFVGFGCVTIKKAKVIKEVYRKL